MILVNQKKLAIWFFSLIILTLIVLTLFYGKNFFIKHGSANRKSIKISSKINTKNFDKTSDKTLKTTIPNSKNLVKNNISRDTSIISNNNILLLLNRSNRNELFNSPSPINSNIFSINKKAGKIVALTFDDGPSKEFTKKYVDVLKSLNVKATFFVVGKMAEKNPDLLKYIADNGNEIGLHSYSHQYMPKMSPQQIIDELYKTQAIIVNATGIKPDLFRPPYGAFNNTLLKIANALGLHVVLWTVDPDDWKNPGISNIINTTVSKTSHGSVILMHEGKAETLAALPQIVERLKSKGYSFATISELMNAGN
ncbi:polysaccharide deacetylase family protein [Thermoanaerobacterium thermosaccharolyticum]|uniref:polysaccharide deacetylase family protein n=1 Tax=Thermoanaerobacterium thermosaccharolyticum TaxID=1517 RepID=UPI003DAA3E45